MHSPNTYNRIFKGSVFMRVLKIFDKQTYVHLCNIIFAFCNKKLPKATYLGELLCEVISLFLIPLILRKSLFLLCRQRASL